LSFGQQLSTSLKQITHPVPIVAGSNEFIFLLLLDRSLPSCTLRARGRCPKAPYNAAFSTSMCCQSGCGQLAKIAIARNQLEISTSSRGAKAQSIL
jgi:hypothetical protein